MVAANARISSDHLRKAYPAVGDGNRGSSLRLGGPGIKPGQSCQPFEKSRPDEGNAREAPAGARAPFGAEKKDRCTGSAAAN